MTDTRTDSLLPMLSLLSCPVVPIADTDTSRSPGRELMLRIWQMHKAELHSSVTNLRLGRRQQTKVAMKLGGLDGTWMDAWWDDMGCLMMPGMPSLTQCFFLCWSRAFRNLFGSRNRIGRYMEIPYGSVWIRMDPYGRWKTCQSELSSHAADMLQTGAHCRPGV